MTAKPCLTPDQFRAQLFRKGKTLTQWGKERGYSFKECSRVLNGQVKGRYGRGHEIAVAMGLKATDNATQHFVAGQPTTRAATRNPQARVTA